LKVMRTSRNFADNDNRTAAEEEVKWEAYQARMARQYRHLKVRGHRTKFLNCLDKDDLTKLVEFFGGFPTEQRENDGWNAHAVRLRRQLLKIWRVNPDVYTRALRMIRRKLG
jgi:hypothetical protein